MYFAFWFFISGNLTLKSLVFVCGSGKKMNVWEKWYLCYSVIFKNVFNLRSITIITFPLCLYFLHHYPKLKNNTRDDTHVFCKVGEGCTYFANNVCIGLASINLIICNLNRVWKEGKKQVREL